MSTSHPLGQWKISHQDHIERFEQLRDLYEAETHLLETLPRMAEAAANDSDASLRQSFLACLEETKEHLRQLEELFDYLEGRIAAQSRVLGHSLQLHHADCYAA